jgi:hypothetical protein
MNFNLEFYPQSKYNKAYLHASILGELRFMGKWFDKIFNVHNLAGLMLLMVIIITIASIVLPNTVPANLAPQLEATPEGTPVVITDDTIRTDTWQLTYPRGWRIVKSSTATDPVQVVLVAPDDAMTITVGEQVLADADEVVELEQATLYVKGAIAEDVNVNEATLVQMLDDIVASITEPAEG